MLRQLLRASLLAPAAANWITNGGSVFNQRYSPLKQINRESAKASP